MGQVSKRLPGLTFSDIFHVLMRSKTALSGALIALLVAACADSPTQPAALVTAETRAAIRIASVLPTLPALIDAADSVAAVDARSRLAHARSLWQLADVLGDEANARRLRDEAYAEAIPILSRTLTDAQVADASARLQKWTALAGSVVRPGAIPGFSAALEDGQALLQQCRRGRFRGSPDRRAQCRPAVRPSAWTRPPRGRSGRSSPGRPRTHSPGCAGTRIRSATPVRFAWYAARARR